MFVYKMASVQEKAELVKFVHECGSIVAAQRRYRLEFNRAPPHRNSIRRWVKQFSESGDVKKKKSPGRPRVSDQTVDDVRTAMLLSPHTRPSEDCCTT
jgi:transposase